MINIYYTDLETNEFTEINEFRKGAWIHLVNPSEKEISFVCNNLNIEEDFIRYPLDFEEKARIDTEDDVKLFIIDVPIIEEKDDDTIYTTMPLGMIVVRDDFFITVSLHECKFMDDFINSRVKGFFTYKKTRFILQILYTNSSAFLSILKQITKESEATVCLLQKSMKNRELIQLLNLVLQIQYQQLSLL